MQLCPVCLVDLFLSVEHAHWVSRGWNVGVNVVRVNLLLTLTGFRITQETCFRVCLWWSFQRDLAAEITPSLGVSDTSNRPWALEWIQWKHRGEPWAPAVTSPLTPSFLQMCGDQHLPCMIHCTLKPLAKINALFLKLLLVKSLVTGVRKQSVQKNDSKGCYG